MERLSDPEGKSDEPQAATDLAAPAHSLYGELGRTPRVRRRGLRFADEESFLKALALLGDLVSEGPVQYHSMSLPSGPALALPEWSYRLLAPLLDEHKIPYREVKVIPMSDLPPDRQAQLRGLRD
ncbi:MAG: hypothetical protein H0V51_23700 [Chloroflexi bacterium]|nr:hypothetical protein [Chloroflexota bacterium]